MSVSKTVKMLKLLFIGNSATYVNDIPGTLSRLATKAGYCIECSSVVKGRATLTDHADTGNDLGKEAFEAIEKGFDIVFLQDNSSCISNEAMKEASKNACYTLDAAVKRTGAKTGIYFRPPSGREYLEYDSLAQCMEFDRHFGEISECIGALNVYVNRAFAYAIKNTEFKLWGADNAHTSEYGAYLAVCVFFTALFRVSASVLDGNGLSEKDARELQAIADKITLDGVSIESLEI